MSKSAPNVLDQIFSTRDLFRPRCLIVWGWSICSSTLLLGLIIVFGLFLGILADRGRLSTDISLDEVPRFSALTGLAIEEQHKKEDGVLDETTDRQDVAEKPQANDAASKEPVAGDSSAKIHIEFLEHGILPSVWRCRHFWWGNGLGWLFRNVQMLSSNILAAILLLTTGLVLASARVCCLSQLRIRSHRVAIESLAGTRRSVHRQALRLGAEDLDGTRIETARNLFMHEIEDVRNHLTSWTEYEIRYPLELACLGLLAISIQPLMTAQCLLILGVAWFFIEYETKKAETNRKLAGELAATELASQAEALRSARLVRGLGIEQFDHDHFANHLLKYNALCARQDLATHQASFLRPRNFIICAAATTFLTFILTTHILLGQRELSIAGGAVFISLWIFAEPGVRALRSIPGLRQAALRSAEKIHTYLDQIPSVSQAVGAKFQQPLAKVLHFDSVVYQSPTGRKLLNELDLKLEAGQTYSLVSLDPLESLALASMLPRFIEPQKGRVLFDGEDIAWATLESLRAEVVFVGAHDPLLPGNVMDNIRGGRGDYTLQQVTDAAKISHAHNFIVKLYDGYESDLPERADQMDVSQRYRLGLARAVIRNPALLIIEEPHETLDEDSKSLIADAYDRICQDRTVIFLPGRLSTVRRSDQVIVLHEGRVAAIGPQARLVGLSAIYRHWEYSKFNEFRHQES